MAAVERAIARFIEPSQAVGVSLHAYAVSGQTAATRHTLSARFRIVDSSQDLTSKWGVFGQLYRVESAPIRWKEVSRCALESAIRWGDVGIRPQRLPQELAEIET